MPEKFRSGEGIDPKSPDVSGAENPRVTKAEMARRLRETPAFRVLFEVLKGSPDLFDEIREVLDRKDEFVVGAQKKGRSNRALTALFAALNLSERGGALLDETIQRKVEYDRSYMVEQIRKGNNYSPELVIGTGPESVIYNSERFAFLPSDPALTVDKEKKIAGLWGPVFKAVWDLNSRTRPKNVDLPNLPGTEGSLNDLGETVLQQSDIEGLAYGSQEKLRKAIETDHAVMSSVANEIQVLKVRKNRTKARGRYEIDLLDKANGDILKFYTERAIPVTGLGMEISGLDESDPETKQILEEERAIAEAGGDAKVSTLPEFVQRMGAKEDAFPIRGWKKVIATGPNDSGRIAAGIVLGYETQLGKTVSQLDRVESLDWIGQTLRSKEEVQRCERLRYATLGVEFPRESDSDYYHRINPKAGRAERLRRDGENIQVIYQLYETDSEGKVIIDEDTGRKRIKTGADGRPVEEVSIGDHVVLNNGFIDRTDEIFAPLNNEVIEDPAAIADAYLEALNTPGTVFYLKDDRTVEITDVSDERIEYVLRYVEDDGRQMAITQDIRDEESDLVNPQNIRLIELANGVPPERELVYEDDLREEANSETFTEEAEILANLERALLTKGARIFVKGEKEPIEVLGMDESGTLAGVIRFSQKISSGFYNDSAYPDTALRRFKRPGLVEALEVPIEIKPSEPQFEIIGAGIDPDRLVEAATTVGTIFAYTPRLNPLDIDQTVATIEITRVEGEGADRTILYEPRLANGRSLGEELFDIGNGRVPRFLVNGARYPVLNEVRVPRSAKNPEALERVTEVTDPAEIKRRLKTFPVVPGAKAYFAPGSSVRSLEVVESEDVDTATKTLFASLRITFANGSTERFNFTTTSLEISTPEKFGNQFLEEIAPFGLEAEDLEQVDRITVPASPIAARYKDEEIYFAGPSSKLPLTNAEINRAPVLGSIKENVAAIFRYSSYVAALSRGLAKRDLKRTEVPKNVAAERPKMATKELPKPEPGGSEMILPLDMRVSERKRALPPNFAAADFLKLAAGNAFFQYRLPKELQEISLEVRALSEAEKADTEIEGKIGLEMRVRPGLPDEYMKPLYRFIADEVVEKILLQYTDRSLVASGRVAITIPTRDGKVDAAGVELRSLRGAPAPRPEAVA